MHNNFTKICEAPIIQICLFLESNQFRLALYNIKGCISYVPLERYVVYKMNALRQLFEMSLLLLLKNCVCTTKPSVHPSWKEYTVSVQNSSKEVTA